MCLSHTWQYKCGCIAPKPTNNPLYRCTSWEFGRSCDPKPLFSYLDIDCCEQCRRNTTTCNDERYQSHQDDWYLYNGPYQGEPSEEDYYFNRVPKQLVEPFFVRNSRRRRRTAVHKRSLSGAEEQEVVVREDGKEVESSDGEDLGLLDLHSDNVADESRPEEHVSKITFGGRFSRRRK